MFFFLTRFLLCLSLDLDLWLLFLFFNQFWVFFFFFLYNTSHYIKKMFYILLFFIFYICSFISVSITMHFFSLSYFAISMVYQFWIKSLLLNLNDQLLYERILECYFQPFFITFTLFRIKKSAKFLNVMNVCITFFHHYCYNLTFSSSVDRPL